MQLTITVSVKSALYEDYDDCLAAAEKDAQSRLKLHGWALDPRWADDQRSLILLALPGRVYRSLNKLPDGTKQVKEHDLR